MEQGDQELLLAKEFFESIGIECYDIIPPINSDVYCVKRIDCQWATFKIGNLNPIIPFGKYSHMWGYDNGYCLVSVLNTDRMVFANKGIIDEAGNEIIKPYTFQNIWSFYGKNESTILVQASNKFIKIPRSLLKLL